MNTFGQLLLAVKGIVHKISKIEGNISQFVTLICRELDYSHGFMIQVYRSDGESFRVTSECKLALYTTPSCFKLHEHGAYATVDYIACSNHRYKVNVQIYMREVNDHVTEFNLYSFCAIRI
jgi:hypothetical protein